jgi:tetratricopeptide (TPR) repeat protein
MNQMVALAYCQENQSSVNKILQDFKNTSIQFKFVSSNSHAEPSIYNQLEDFDGPIVLLISVNFLRSISCMQNTLSLVTRKANNLVPILVSGTDADPMTGEIKEVPTLIDKIGDIIPYINYWQSQYLEARSRKTEIRADESDKMAFENHSNLLRMLSSEAGETLRHLRKFLPPSLVECRSLKNKYQLLQDQLIEFPFQDNLFLEDEPEQTIEDDLSFPPPIPITEYIVFEEEEIEVASSSDIYSGEFNFTSSSNEDSTILINNEYEEIVNVDHLVSDEITEPIQTLPIGTTDLTLPRTEQAAPEVSFTFETSVIKEEEILKEVEEEKEDITIKEEEEEQKEQEAVEQVLPTVETESSLEAATSLYKQIEKQYPTDVERQYFHLKLVLREAENDHQKISFLQHFIERNGHQTEAKLALSKILLSQNKWEEAKSVLEELLLIDPNHGESLYELASIIISHFPEKMERAGNLLKQCIKQSSFPKEALYTYAIYLSNISNKPYKALEYYLKTIEGLPNHKFAYYDLATFYFNEGEKKIAKEFYLKAIQNNPELKIRDNDLAFEVDDI